MKFNTRTVAICGFLIALAALLSGPLAIKLNLFGGYMKNISFGSVPVMFAGAVLGPLAGFCVGCCTDVLSYVIMPTGAYFPGFTVVLGLMGLIPSFFLYKKKETGYFRVLLAVGVTHAICSLCLNSLMLIVFFKLSPQIIFMRAAIQCIMIPIFSGVVMTLIKISPKFIKRD